MQILWERHGWDFMCVCTYVNIYMYTYMHITIYRNIYTNINIFNICIFLRFCLIYIHSYFYTYTNCTQTHTYVCVYVFVRTDMYIRHAWKFLGGLGVLNMFSWQRRMCLFLFHLFPTLLFHPKGHWGESMCSGIPALSQRRENCLDVNVGLKGHVFIAVF